MDIKITHKQFMEAALEQEKAALDFFDQVGAMGPVVAGGLGMSDSFLDKKRAEIAEIERKLEDGEYDDEPV